MRGWKSKDRWNDKLGGKADKLERSSSVLERSDTQVSLVNDLEFIGSTELTEKQQLFCLYYIKYFSGTKAYKKVFGGNDNTARRYANRLLQQEKISQTIKELKDAKFTREMLESDDIFQKYVDIAFADINAYVSFGTKNVIVDGESKTVNYVEVKESDDVDGTLISEIRSSKGEVHIKLADRMKALQWLAENISTEDSDSNLLAEATKKLQERLEAQQVVNETV